MLKNSKPVASYTQASLQAAMLAKLAGSGLTAKHAKTLRLRPQLTAPVALPAASAGFVIPYFTPQGVLTDFYRYRYLESTLGPWDALVGRKPLRYGQPAHTRNEAYMPPIWPTGSTHKDWAAYAADATAPLIITEGELKAAAACAAGLPTVGLGGVWCFMAKKSGLSLLPELQDFNWDERVVNICYDSDAASNVNVVTAENALAKKLTELGADVRIVRLPVPESGAKCGLDDYLVQYGVDLLRMAVAAAQPYSASQALRALSERVCYVRNPGIIYDWQEDQQLAPRNFTDHAFSNHWHEEYTYDKDGNLKANKVRTARAWLDWPSRSEARRFTFAPGQPAVTAAAINLWRGWPVEPKPGDMTPWLQGLAHVFQGPESEAAQRWFLQWAAYPLQHPGTKLLTSVLLWSAANGSGKTLLGSTLARLYGSYACEIKDAQLRDTRNEWAQKKQFVVADDITGQDSRQLQNLLKTMTTQETIAINPKYIPSFTLPDTINYLYTSNDPAAFFLDDTDRRYFVWELCGGPMPADVWKPLVKWRDSVAGQQALFHYLLNLDLKGFDPAGWAPATLAKDDMRLLGKSDLGAWVAALRTEPARVLGSRDAGGDLWSAQELHAIYDPLGEKRAGISALARELKRAGFNAPANGSPLLTPWGQRRVYVLRNVGAYKMHRHATAHYVEHRSKDGLPLENKLNKLTTR